MATLKEKLSSLVEGVVEKLNSLYLMKENISDKKDTLDITDAKFYPNNRLIKAELLKKQDTEPGKGLSEENFTLAEKDKLNTLRTSLFRGVYRSEGALPRNFNEDGSFADVNTEIIGEDVTRYIWDTTNSKWTPLQTVIPEISASEIKSLYESNADTNVFSDEDVQRAIDGEEHRLSRINPHNVTASQLSLGNVDNTADVDKPLSEPQKIVTDTIQLNLDTYIVEVVGEGPFPDYAAQLTDNLNF